MDDIYQSAYTGEQIDAAIKRVLEGTQGGDQGGSSNPPAVLINKRITSNGSYSAADDGVDGYSSVSVDVKVSGDVELPALKTPTITFDNYTAKLTINDTANGEHTEQWLIYYGDNYIGSTRNNTIDLFSLTEFLGNADIQVIASSEQFIDSRAAVVRWNQPIIPLAADFYNASGMLSITEYDKQYTDSFDIYVDEQLILNTTDTTVILFDHVSASVSTRTVRVVAISNNSYFLNSRSFQTEWKALNDGTPGLEYSIDTENGYAICTGRGTSTDPDVVIASTYDGYPVTRIADNAFASNKADYSIGSVFIPESVTHIGDHAFLRRYGIDALYIPSSLIYIGAEAFHTAENIFIQDMSAWCNMEWVHVGQTPPLWLSNSKLYVNNELVTDLIIPDDVFVIPRSRFRGLKQLTSIHIPSHVTQIGAYALTGCDGVITATIPKTVTAINATYPFGSDALQDLIFAPSVDILPVGVLNNCPSLKRLALGKSLRVNNSLIEDDAFPVLSELYYEGSEEEFTEAKTSLNLPIPDNVTIRYNVDLDNFTFPEEPVSISAGGEDE